MTSRRFLGTFSCCEDDSATEKEEEEGGAGEGASEAVPKTILGFSIVVDEVRLVGKRLGDVREDWGGR